MRSMRYPDYGEESANRHGIGMQCGKWGFGDTHEPHAADDYEEGSEKHAALFCRVGRSLQSKEIKI